MLAGRQYFTRAEQAYDRAVALIRSLDETPSGTIPESGTTPP